MAYRTEEQQREYLAWLKTLKAGDEVAVVSSGYQDRRGYDRGYDKVTVKSVTPGGRVRLTNDKLYNNRGERHFGGTWGGYDWLEPWTEAIDKLLDRRKLVAQVGIYLDFNIVSRELLDKASDEDLVALRDRLRKFRVDKK